MNTPSPLIANVSVASAKAALRSAYRERRQRIAGRAELSARICDRLETLPEIASARTVHVYWPMLDRGEVDLRPFIRTLLERKVRVAIPVMSTDRAPMTARQLAAESDLVRNDHGVSEPLHGPSVPFQEIDVVIAPALVVGRNGYRLGYGRGHYDAFLRETRSPTVCATFAECVIPAVPAEPHDVPVSMIVTENEVIHLPGL